MSGGPGKIEVALTTACHKPAGAGAPAEGVGFQLRWAHSGRAALWPMSPATAGSYMPE